MKTIAYKTTIQINRADHKFFVVQGSHPVEYFLAKTTTGKVRVFYRFITDEAEGTWFFGAGKKRSSFHTPEQAHAHMQRLWGLEAWEKEGA